MKTIGTRRYEVACMACNAHVRGKFLRQLHEIEGRAKETPEDMRQDLALPILESSSTGSWSNSAQTSEDSYAV